MKIIKKILATERGHRLISYLLALYIKLVYKTTRWQVIGRENPEQYLKKDQPFLVCFWHGRLAMLMCSWAWDKPFSMLQSSHRDGQITQRILTYFNIESIAGSTHRGGTQAMRALIKALRSGITVGITPDGPRGPAQIASPGVVSIAKLAEVDIIPLTFSTHWRCVLKTWDRFHVPLPFSHGVFIWGKAIPVDKDPEKTRVMIENALNQIQLQADKLCGHP